MDGTGGEGSAQRACMSSRRPPGEGRARRVGCAAGTRVGVMGLGVQVGVKAPPLRKGSCEVRYARSD
jgi:hypothetical protein